MPKFSRVLLIVTLLSLLPQLSLVFANERRGGSIVWWGHDSFRKDSYSSPTNGVIEREDEIEGDIVAIAARQWQGFALRKDGTVFEFSRGFWSSLPRGLSNVVSITMAGNSCWAIKGDGTVAQWGSDEDSARIVPTLTNVSSIVWVGYRSYLALRTDGTLIGLRFDASSPHTDPASGLPIPIPEAATAPVRVNRQILSNITDVAYMGGPPIILQGDGMVFYLEGKKLAEAFSGSPFQYETKRPIEIDGSLLGDVSAIAASGTHMLVVRSNGTVVALGNNQSGQCNVPTDLSNVVVVAAAAHRSLALKRDGTVVAWGGNSYGETSVPAGLSNVIAIAAGGFVSLAITTGAIPASVYVRPHGRLGELEREADFIFKGQVISSKPVTNTSFPDWGKPHATQFKLISVLKGSVATNAPIFWHNTSGPMGWGGGTPPSWHQFQEGQCYLVFAVNLDKPAYLYSPPPDATSRPHEFRQTRNDGVTRTSDARSISGTDVKDVHWKELNLLLKDTNPTNQIYAVGLLNELSPACGPHHDWQHTKDFKREAVLQSVQPLLTNNNDEVAMSAFSCFQLGGISTRWIHGYHCWLPTIQDCPITPTDCLLQIIPFTDSLIAIANSKATGARRAAALAALSGTRMLSVSNSLSQWLADSDEVVRAMAVQLLPEYDGEFCQRSLRDKAGDASPMVRAAVADAIGKGMLAELLPTLKALLSEPASPKERKSPCFQKSLLLHGLFGAADSRDVHASAGYALLSFDATRAGDVFKANLNDPNFGSQFLCKLAKQNPQAWLDEMTKHLETRLAKEKQLALGWGGDPEKYEPALSGTAFQLWNIMYDHFQGAPFVAFANGTSDRYLSILERSGNTGSREPLLLYELYKMKGLNKRAAKYRNDCEGKHAAYNMKQFFDKIDPKYPMNGTIPDQ